MNAVIGYSILFCLLATLVVAVSWSFVGWLVSFVLLVRLLLWACGWKSMPKVTGGAGIGHVESIPCFHDRKRLTGAWADGDPGELPGKGSWWVYRHYGEDGSLVYLGKTKNPQRRFWQHANDVKDGHALPKAIEERWSTWELFECASEEEMSLLEQAGICFCAPETNIERYRLERYTDYDGGSELVVAA